MGKMMKVSCHSCHSWKECAQTKVKLAQAQYIKSRTYTAHFWTEFAINEIIQVLKLVNFLLLCIVRPIKCKVSKDKTTNNPKLKYFLFIWGKVYRIIGFTTTSQKIFLQLLPLNITRRSLKYYELKNIYHLSFNKDQVRCIEGNKRMGGNLDKYTGHSTIMTIHKKKTKLPKNEENTFDKLSFALHKLLC